jgi:hypothetical protein
VDGLAREQAGPAHAVAAHVHEAAAVERRVEPDVRGVGEREAEDGADHTETPDRSLLDELLQPLRLGVVAVHERFHEQAEGPVGGVEGALDVVGVAAEWLLAEDVLARFQRADRPVDVQGVRE